MSSISIIGSGGMAAAIGGLAARAGHTVELMSRDAAKAQALAEQVEQTATPGQGAEPLELDVDLALSRGFRRTVLEYLRLLAVARLFFDNIAHLQSSWLTTGKDVGQLSLHMGVDDLGSIMLEENVISSAGARQASGARGRPAT